jgi:hypothetical protein
MTTTQPFPFLPRFCQNEKNEKLENIITFGVLNPQKSGNTKKKRKEKDCQIPIFACSQY